MPDNLKAPPRVARALTGPGRLPKVENLIDKTPDQLMFTLNRFGIAPDLKAIDQRARRSFQTLERLIEEGVEPDEATWARITEQHEREMAQTLRQMTKQAIRLYRRKKLAEGGGQMMWLTVADNNVCPSCEPRHGQVKTLKQWQRIGLPGSSALVCSQECRCQLLPAGEE